MLALLRGEPGPFLENEKSFFGRKRVDPSMKDRPMETDCGGMLITKAKMTYGEADELTRRVDLTDFPAFWASLSDPGSPYRRRWKNTNPYWHTEPDGKFYVGMVWWSIYSFLATKGLIAGDPESYNNALEYLYNEVLKRLVAAGVFTVDLPGWRYFVPAAAP